MKEKKYAKELVEKFHEVKTTMLYDEAKQCALICCNERIKEFYELFEITDMVEPSLNFHIEVKRIIQEEM